MPETTTLSEVRKAIFLEQAGAFKDDESMDELIAQIYRARGRPEIE